MADTLGQRLKARRLELGLTLQAVADASYTSKGHVHDIENGNTKKPSFEVIQYIALCLGVPLDELAGLI